MDCLFANACGGCKYRNLEQTAYQKLKIEKIKKILSTLKSTSYRFNEPVFVSDGCRRRATFAFMYKKKKLIFGFNESNSKEIVDIKCCPLLTSKINDVLSDIRNFLAEFCAENYTEKHGKKLVTRNIASGDLFIGEADNGLDIVIECEENLSLSHKMMISDFCNTTENIIRVSHRNTPTDEAETIIEKIKPIVKMGAYSVEIPAGTFLQPSRQGQEILGKLVLKGLQGTTGKIADLFCGVGTFSYLLADMPHTKIVSLDSSKALLKGFQDSVNHNRISNISVIQKNLFKYPFSTEELKEYNAIVFDPPRAGAAKVCETIASTDYKLDKIVAVSCNPATFVNDANKLISGGYVLQEITVVDQFVYSDHSELVAFFTKA